jgi:hypothetical protein
LLRALLSGSIAKVKFRFRLFFNSRGIQALFSFVFAARPTAAFSHRSESAKQLHFGLPQLERTENDSAVRLIWICHVSEEGFD